MYNAPSVAYPVGRCALQRRVFWGLVFLSMSVMAAWAMLQPLSWAWCAAWLPLGWGFVSGWHALRVHGELRWQGETWVLWLTSSHDTNPWEGGALRLACDAQRVLLLQWTPSCDSQGQSPLTATFKVPRRSEWLWLDKDNAPEHWQDLRRAVHAHTSVN